MIHTLDRLYRPENDGDEWRVFELLNQLQTMGVEVAWVDTTIPSEGPLSSIFMFLDSWRSGRERRQMVERSVRGKREKARRGKVVNPHSLPKWLRYDRSTEQVELDEEWTQVGRLLFHLVGEEGLTLRASEPALPDPRYSVAEWRFGVAGDDDAQLAIESRGEGRIPPAALREKERRQRASRASSRRALRAQGAPAGE